MTKKLFIFAFSILTATLNAQSVPRAFENWKSTAGTQNFFYKNVIKTDGSGNVIVAGSTMSNGAPDILVAKYNPSGNLLWIQQFAGAATNGVDFAAGLYVTDNYVYLTGAITNNTVVPETDCITMKLASSTGSVVWSTTYAGAAGSIDGGKNITIDVSDNVYVSGLSYNSSINSDYLTLRYNSSGVQQWVSTWDYAGGNDASVKVAVSGSFVNVSGAVTTTTANVYKLATLKLAIGTGSLQSTNISSAVTTTSVDVVCDMVLDNNTGDIYIAGSNSVGGQGDNFYVQKLSSTLVTAWTYTYNGSGSSNDVAKAIQVDGSGNVFVAGYSTSSTLGKETTIIKLNSSGVNQWTQTSGFSGNDEAADLVLDATGNAYITGYKLNANTGNNYYTAKYSTTGSKIWEIETDGLAKDDNGTNLCLDTLNNVVVTGQSETEPGVYRFLTTKYVQKDVTNPVDLFSQPTNASFGYYANKGQILDAAGSPATSVLYYTHHQNPDIYIEKNSYNYVFQRIDSIYSTMDTIEKIKVNFVNSNANTKPYGYNPKTYTLNYLLGNIPEFVTDVMGNDRVITQNIYPNIDLHYYSNSSGMKYYFVVNPGGEVKDITLNFSGANSTTITANKLFIDGNFGDITLKRPYAYMVNGLTTTTLTGNSSWNSGVTNTFGITVPSYTTSQTLVIVIETSISPASPLGTVQNLNYSTYYGGSATDVFKDIKVMPDNQRFVTGYTTSANFPITAGSSLIRGVRDAVILRYTAGDSLKYATFFGANGDDTGNSIDVNSSGIFIGGKTTSTNFPTTTNTGQANQQLNGGYPTYPTYEDGFITKLNGTANGFFFSRYYGGTKQDEITSICLDAAGNLFFTGYAFSTDIPMVNAAQPTVGVATANNCDAIVGKINTSFVMVYNTYFGGSNSGTVTTITQDIGNDITVDNNGNAIVVGWSDCVNLPVGNPNNYTNTFYQSVRKGVRDGFIVRYSPTGTKNFATWLGGNGIDEIKRVRYDKTNNLIYFAGESTDTTAFPFVTRGGAFNYRKKITRSAFIGAMDSGLGKIWSSYYGRSGSMNVTGLSVDNAGLFYLSGYTSDLLTYPSSAPLLPVYNDSTNNGGYDGFVAIFNLNQNLYHAHYLGGAGSDMINNSDIGNQKFYVVGNTQSANFPIAYSSALIGAQIDSTANGSDDGFITRFDLSNYTIAGINQIKFEDGNLLVYPNPANTMFNINLTKDIESQTTLKVYTVMGQLIYETEMTNQVTQVPCNNWSNGVYLLNVSNKESSKTFKVIKQ